MGKSSKRENRSRSSARASASRHGRPADKAKRDKTVVRAPALGDFRLGERFWIVLGASSILLLLYVCRGGAFGIPVSDDYVYLYWLRFHHPFDFLDSMGAPFYWRPLTRQIYYSAVQSLLLNTPRLVTALHVVLLLVLYFVLYRVARRFLSAPLAAAAASFPLLAEPTRVLITWPTQIQYLLPMLCGALAIHEALAGRLWTASLAGLAAVLGHEWGAFVVAVLPIVTWLRTRNRAETLRWAAVSGGILVLWSVAHKIAESRGATFVGPPPQTGIQAQLLALLETFGRAVVAQLNLEDVAPGTQAVLAATYGFLAVVAIVFAIRRDARRRLANALGPILGGIIWWVAGIAPLALVVIGWNSWRSTLPGVWLGFSVIGFFGLVRPWLAAAFVAVRILALLAAPVATPVVSNLPPRTTSPLGYLLITRQQYTVESTRRELEKRYPTLRRGANIGYWARLPMTEVAFYDQMAPRVWYNDSTVAWRWLWDRKLLREPVDAAVDYNADTENPAVILEPAALAQVHLGIKAFDEHRFADLDRAATGALRAQGKPTRDLGVWSARTAAKAAYYQGQYARADSMNRLSYLVGGESADYYGMSGALALRAGKKDLAALNARRALQLNPKNRLGLEVMQELASQGKQ